MHVKAYLPDTDDTCHYLTETGTCCDNRPASPERRADLSENREQEILARAGLYSEFLGFAVPECLSPSFW